MKSVVYALVASLIGVGLSVGAMYLGNKAHDDNMRKLEAGTLYRGVKIISVTQVEHSFTKEQLGRVLAR